MALGAARGSINRGKNPGL